MQDQSPISTLEYHPGTRASYGHSLPTQDQQSFPCVDGPSIPSQISIGQSCSTRVIYHDFSGRLNTLHRRLPHGNILLVKSAKLVEKRENRAKLHALAGVISLGQHVPGIFDGFADTGNQPGSRIY